MLNDLLLHPITYEALSAVLHNHPHALLLRSKRGMGKGYIAATLAAEILGCTPEQLPKQPYYLRITPENDSIKIEQIREIKKFVQLKTAGQATIRRVVIIEDIMSMGDEAQNALLKLLEEPPADTVIILTATPSAAVRPTIVSRSHVVAIQTPTKQQTLEYYQSKGYPKTEIEKALAMSRGAVGLLQALLESKDHPMVEQIKLAKEILASTEYQRLVKVDRIAKDRLAIEALLEALASICEAALQQTAKTNSTTKLRRWYRSMEAVDQATQALRYKPSGKLLLTNLFLQL